MTSMNAQSVAEILTTTLSGLLAVGLAAATGPSRLPGSWHLDVYRCHAHRPLPAYRYAA